MKWWPLHCQSMWSSHFWRPLWAAGTWTSTFMERSTLVQTERLQLLMTVLPLNLQRVILTSVKSLWLCIWFYKSWSFSTLWLLFLQLRTTNTLSLRVVFSTIPWFRPYHSTVTTIGTALWLVHPQWSHLWSYSLHLGFTCWNLCLPSKKKWTQHFRSSSTCHLVYSV